MPRKKTVHLSEYKPFPFSIENIRLDFNIEENNVVVTSLLLIKKNDIGCNELLLQGVDIDLQSISINDDLISEEFFHYLSPELKINCPLPEKFTLKTVCKIDPFNNHSLEGLYSSENMLITQCEAEGFRRITFFPDRPDVLTRFWVRIEADKNLYPVLLSNGDKISFRDLPSNSSRHEVEWFDPHPKPSYLFALVAGSLDVVNDQFVTKSGKEVDLNIYVDIGSKNYVKHALSSLKKAMDWDERVYGLEYDLDQYNVVGVRHFNMGAMENKSLNIFNSKLILADSKTATDDELERIESVIAHEYFHNWTGNRITCRDWFQLSLKEGLTVFRDQSFTADLHSYPVKRIEDVSLLRRIQFREDAGPTAHPVKPSRYESIDNFYTTTIYEKGAEIIRMLHTILGQERFMQGISTYVEKFDGKAATTEDFISSVSEGASSFGNPLEFNIDQFYLWYLKSGTPKVSIKTEWDSKSGEFKIIFKQSNPNIISNDKQKPYVIPIVFNLVGPHGPLCKEKKYILDTIENEIVLKNIPATKKAPSLSVFRNFSAPVTWEIDSSLDSCFNLFLHDDNTFCRWDAGQTLFKKVLLARTTGQPNHEVENRLIDSLKDLIDKSDKKDFAILASLLTLPGNSEIEELQLISDPLSVYNSAKEFHKILGKKLFEPLSCLLDRCRSSWNDEWPNGVSERKLTALALFLLSASGEKDVLVEALEMVKQDLMTLTRAALNALQQIECDERNMALEFFYQRWKHSPIILDTWFFFQATTPFGNGLERIRFLLDHKKFDPMAPNALRAVLGGLAANPTVFHSLDGSGYLFMAKEICSLDQRNPITASRLVKVFSPWKSYAPFRQDQILNALNVLSDQAYSSNTREIIQLIRGSDQK